MATDTRPLETYGEAARQLLDFLADNGMPTDDVHVRREHVECWIESLLTRRKPSTANTRFRGAASLFNLCVEEGELAASPTAKMKPPAIPEVPVDVVRDHDLRQLLKRATPRTPRDAATPHSFGSSWIPACGAPRSQV
jgi:hypothetical protein